MKIALINGSPKPGNSNSGILLDKIEPLLNEGNELTSLSTSGKEFTPDQYRSLCEMDVLLFAFPLYIDALPSHLFRIIIELERYMKEYKDKEIRVYVIVNNGFYEGHQCHIAMKIMENWCKRSELSFCGGIGQGAGEMIGATSNVPFGHGPLKDLSKAMSQIADHITSGTKGQKQMLSPNVPRFFWKMMGTHFFWNTSARKNHLKRIDILRQL
ncbi:NAD(P)H-dependent oxidoreductase [Anoxybacterium hadale]|uniref:NAD(P)H-dependent oxidoreductase n=1 Tax=Anoxybacterium hadale TaxID=3408580 RepID=A0ACD1A8K6_9FIRM|nr:NAD(P)H-dependent oxidoreductase [Clostridiales bacterium]